MSLLLLSHINKLYRCIHHLEGDTGSNRLNVQNTASFKSSIFGFVKSTVMGLSCWQLHICMDTLTCTSWLSIMLQTKNDSAAFNCLMSNTPWNSHSHTLITSVVYTIFGKSHDSHGLKWRHLKLITRSLCGERVSEIEDHCIRFRHH